MRRRGAGGSVVRRTGGPGRGSERPGATLAIAVGLALTALAPAHVDAQASRPHRVLAAELDRAVRAHVEHPTVPGVSVAVVRGDETVLLGGYGYVDLEWNARTPVDGSASYEIGSVTKQFTAAALLLLAEEGLVDLDADFTRYVDFDTGGRTVTVRRLLDHTSGIKGYTEMPVFGSLTPFELPRDSLLRLVERELFEFEPGGAQIYNNSAYFILGLLIEEVSGKSYEDFVAERLFEPAGMTRSYYCDELEIRDWRAHGYDAASPDSLVRARYLDHTWPYAAGSLCSTVGDLLAWNRALHGGTVLSEASYRAMTTPAPLEDDTPIRYAMGLLVDSLGGRLEISHGGGINGFVSRLAYYPDEELSVVVLQNSAASPGAGALARELAEIVLGPAPEVEPATYQGDLDELGGTYRGPARGRMLEMVVSVDDGVLTLRSGPDDDDPATPAYRGGLRWDAGRTRYVFVREDGRVTELRVDVGSGHYVLRRVEG